MKNTSIFIPLLLIGCLAALIYLFFAALRAAEQGDNQNQDPIVLNEDDYREALAPPDTITLDPPETTASAEAPGSDFLDEVPASEKVMDTEAEDTPATTEGLPGGTPGATPATAPVGVAPPVSARGSNGRYLVIAGTFTQMAGAKDRAAALRAAGFSDTTVERFNRGKYAVALAGQSDSYRTAAELAARIKDRGFEVRVMKRR